MSPDHSSFVGISLRPGLFGKLYLSIALGSILLVWAVVLISDYSEERMSTIAVEHQQQLLAYGQEADALVMLGDASALANWADQVREQENTWLAIVKLSPQWLEGSSPNHEFSKFLSVGRRIDWPIHLHHTENPIMEIPLENSGYTLAIQLPDRMRPGTYWQALHTTITLGLPVLLVAILSFAIYRHLISPLHTLKEATHRFSEGDYSVRTRPSLKKRRDELSELAQSFDHMAERIADLVLSQRQLIQDISHELRTPLTRIKLALEDTKSNDSRIGHELDAMQHLVEDTLTLSWLENENPALTGENVDLSLLLEAISEDARFEFPDRQLNLDLPESCTLQNSNHRALGQALENIIRNALRYTPPETSVNISLERFDSPCSNVKLDILDQGSGVDPAHLEDIFKPFFRAQNARDRDTGGYGLGLALAKRHIEAVGGEVCARNASPGGLCISVELPLKNSKG